MRFAAAHKLVTYLLVLAALAARREHARARAVERARCSSSPCALSFRVEGGSRVALALDRAARGRARRGARAVRGDRLASVAAPARSRRRARRSISCWRCSGYKLFYRRVHRDYIHIAALSFLLVLVASTHRAQLPLRRGVRGLRGARGLGADPVPPAPRDGGELPHQALGPGAQPEGRRRAHPRIAARRRRAFFAATAGWRWRCSSARSRSSCWSRASAPGSWSASRACRAARPASPTRSRSGATGRAPAHRRDVVLRATLPDAARPRRRRRAQRGRGRALFPRRRLRRLRARPLGPQPQARAAHDRRARTARGTVDRRGPRRRWTR